jgi:hypothetical protein
VFVKVSKLDGTAMLYGPAPQSAFDDARPSDRIFSVALAAMAETDIEARLTREIRFDPDLWIVEVEDRAGRNFLDGAIV